MRYEVFRKRESNLKLGIVCCLTLYVQSRKSKEEWPISTDLSHAGETLGRFAACANTSTRSDFSRTLRAVIVAIFTTNNVMWTFVL